MSVEKFSSSDEQGEQEIKKDEKKKSGIVRSLRKVAALGVLTGAVAGMGGEAFAGEKGKQLDESQKEVVQKRSKDAFKDMDDDMRDFDKAQRQAEKRIEIKKETSQAPQSSEFRGKMNVQDKKTIIKESSVDRVRSKVAERWPDFEHTVGTQDLFLSGNDFNKATDALKKDIPLGAKSKYNYFEVTHRKNGKLYFGNNELDQALWVKIKDLYKKITGQIKEQNKGIVDFK